MAGVAAFSLAVCRVAQMQSAAFGGRTIPVHVFIRRAVFRPEDSFQGKM